MKFVYAVLTLAFLSAGTAGAAEKLCRVNAGEYKGTENRMIFSKERVVVKSMPSNHGMVLLEGDFEADQTKTSPEGIALIGYAGYDDGEGIRIWADAALVNPGTTGKARVNTGGPGDAGTDGYVYDCQDFKK
ncbi:hypothetical protein FACS1894124_5230 [Spirochaetia bacterium]|jgi:hypothetical protein|nr:hypothetical protein FACS1894124_5230 [Spirochaetia bacterium]